MILLNTLSIFIHGGTPSATVSADYMNVFYVVLTIRLQYLCLGC